MQTQLSIAVLPFVNMSSDKENEYFSDGITEEIINALAKIGSLKVTSRTSSFYFKGKKLDIREIGKQLDVSMVLEGSVRKAANNVRITTQLINSEDGFHYWSETYDHKLDDIFYIQNQISLEVTEKMREHLGHFDFEEQVVRKKDNLNAYELYLKSKFNFNKFQKEGILLAVQQIEQAIEINDSNNAQYLATKGIYYSYLGLLNVMPHKEAFKRSQEAALLALDIDESEPEAHHAMACAAYFFERDITKAQHYNDLSLEYRPNYPDALMGHSMFCIASQNYDHALDGIQKAVKIDPLSPTLKYYHAAVLMRSNKLKDARKIIDEALELIPFHMNSYSLKGIILTRLGEY